MTDLPFTAFDVAVTLVVLGSALVAVARGFVREVMSVVSWIAAAVIAYFVYPTVRLLLTAAVAPGLLADVAAGLAAFLVPLIVLRVSTGMLANWLAGLGLGGLDRLLGLAFGLLRGGLIVSAAFLIATYMVDERRFPVWVTQARLEPPVKGGAEWLASVLPSRVALQGSKTLQGALQNAQRNRADRSAELPAAPVSGGYRSDSRDQMNHLIEKVQ